VTSSATRAGFIWRVSIYYYQHVHRRSLIIIRNLATTCVRWRSKDYLPRLRHSIAVTFAAAYAFARCSFRVYMVRAARNALLRHALRLDAAAAQQPIPITFCNIAFCTHAEHSLPASTHRGGARDMEQSNGRRWARATSPSDMSRSGPPLLLNFWPLRSTVRPTATFPLLLLFVRRLSLWFVAARVRCHRAWAGRRPVVASGRTHTCYLGPLFVTTLPHTARSRIAFNLFIPSFARLRRHFAFHGTHRLGDYRLRIHCFEKTLRTVLP